MTVPAARLRVDRRSAVASGRVLQHRDTDTVECTPAEPEQKALSEAQAALPIAPLASPAPYLFLDAWGNEIGAYDEPRGVAAAGSRL